MYLLLAMTFTEAVSIVILLLMVWVLLFIRWRQRNILRLAKPASLRREIVTVARVISMEQTGVYMNRQPLMRLHIQVMPAGEKALLLEVHEVLTARDIMLIQRDNLVKVKYNPATPDKVILLKKGN